VFAVDAFCVLFYDVFGVCSVCWSVWSFSSILWSAIAQWFFTACFCSPPLWSVKRSWRGWCFSIGSILSVSRHNLISTTRQTSQTFTVSNELLSALRNLRCAPRNNAC